MKLRILGIRGIPARHGGFETFAEELALYLTRRGHDVTVYCQADEGERGSTSTWQGVHLVTLPGGKGPIGTILFDLRSVLHALRNQGLILTLGYNTAVFSLLYRLFGRTSLMNMDGVEWKRPKWSFGQRLWLRGNEFFGAQLSTHLVADHPAIGKHLEKLVPPGKITVIPYGAETMSAADPALLDQFGCTPLRFLLCIARAEPENSVLEIVRAFSARPRGYPLLVLGKYDPRHSDYHRRVLAAASEEVHFTGAIYDKEVVQALRQYAMAYVHGHRVGGTNPSLVEALAAGSAVIAHRNQFNLWVAGPASRFFATESELDEILSSLIQHPEQLEAMRAGARAMHHERFELRDANRAYEQLLERYAE